MPAMSLDFILVLIATSCITVVLTPLVRSIAFRVGAVDHPNARRINKTPMPSSGGLAVLAAFLVASLVLMPQLFAHPSHGVSYFDYIWPVSLGGLLVGLTGFLDDIFEIRPSYKLLGIILAAILVYSFTDFRFDSFKLPFGGPLLTFSPWLTFILTMVWIIGITNAINLLDGLDGLVSGVALINLFFLGLVANFFLYDTDIFLTLTIFVLMAAIFGFLPYNLYPAIIYLGDAGSLFIGFMIAVLSLQGLKNATAVAVVSPILILGVPIVDTGMAILRRQLAGENIFKPDRMHLHHRLLALGFTHRGAVYVVYAITFVFAMAALLLNKSSRWGGVFLMLGVLFGVGLLIDSLGILGKDRKPLMAALRFIGNSDYRQERLAIWAHQRKQKAKK